MKVRVFKCSVLLVCLLSLAACGKPRLFGKEMEIHPYEKTFEVDSERAFRSAKEAMLYQGYNIQKEDAKNMTLESHWQPTTSDSHYVKFFNRQDRGTVGAYHKLIVKVSPAGKQVKVEVSSLAKSFISNLLSTGIEEEKIFKKIDDFTRKPEIDVTNVGLK